MLSTWILVPSTLITLIFLSFFIKFSVERALYSFSFILTVPVGFISVKVISFCLIIFLYLFPFILIVPVGFITVKVTPLWLIRFLYPSVRVEYPASVVNRSFKAIFPHIFLG